VNGHVKKLNNGTVEWWKNGKMEKCRVKVIIRGRVRGEGNHSRPVGITAQSDPHGVARPAKILIQETIYYE